MNHYVAMPDVETQRLFANVAVQYQLLSQELGSTTMGALILGILHELGKAGALLMNPEGKPEEIKEALTTMVAMGVIAIKHTKVKET